MFNCNLLGKWIVDVTFKYAVNHYHHTKKQQLPDRDSWLPDLLFEFTNPNPTVNYYS